MPSIKDFTLKDMVEFSAALRRMGSDAPRMEVVGDRIVRYLYENLADPKTGEKDCVMVRFFKTHPYNDLDPGMQEAARSMLKEAPGDPDMRCMVLLATAGLLPEWNSRLKSRHHKVIPLPSEHFVEAFPMVRQMIQQMGLELKTVLKPDPAIVIDMTQTTYSVFYIPEALGSRYVPSQEDFIKPFKVRSVIGFGGILPSGNLYVIILFSKVPVPRQTAEMFKSLALSVKVAIMPFVGRNPFA